MERGVTGLQFVSASQEEPSDLPIASAPGQLPAPFLAARSGGGEAARDLQVTRRALSGDAVAREGVLTRLEIIPRVLCVINLRFGRPLSADDLTDLAQQVFLLAWSRLESFDGRVPLEAWAYGIARIEFLSSLRRNRRVPTSVDPDELPDQPESSAVPEIDAERLRSTLARLEHLDARLIHLRHFEDMEFEPIAHELGLTVVNARSRYYRALKRLRSLYGTEGEGDCP
jgi:RNA polymerase sigma-70 factor (ECF subfamily)